MQLFERVELILSLKKMPRYVLAEKLGMKQNTFTRYFCKEHQAKMTPHLWEILKIFPDVNRNWLFFEEGEPFSDGRSSQTDLTGELAQLRLELAEERALNRKLAARLLGEGSGDAPAVGKLARRTDGDSGCVG